MVHIIYTYELDVYITTKVLDCWYDLGDKDQGQMNYNVQYLM